MASMPLLLLKVSLCVLLSLTWFLSGLIINLAQLVIFLAVKPVSPSLFRRLNYLLTYSSWSQLVSLAESFPGSTRVRVFFKDEESRKAFGREASIAISNHALEVDWLLLWCVIDKYGFLASAKAMAKEVIRFFPVLGFNWFFNEFVFLARDWARDQEVIKGCIDVFLSYSKPVMVLLFCEGTRKTSAKFAAGVKYAESRGWTPLRHHLVPRARGFNLLVQHNAQLREAGRKSLGCVFNIQVALKGEEVEGNFYSLIQGKGLEGDVYVERIPFEDIPLHDVQGWLLRLYRRKDDLMDHHARTGAFPGLEEAHAPRLLPLVHSVSWTLILFLLLYVYASPWFLLLLLTSSLLLMGFLVSQSRAKRGSSYGSR